MDISLNVLNSFCTFILPIIALPIIYFIWSSTRVISHYQILIPIVITNEMNRNNHSRRNNQCLASSSSYPIHEINETESDESNNIHVLNIKVKFLNDTIRHIKNVNVNMTVREFKEKHFKDYLDRGQYIKLIFCGRVLNDEDRLGTYIVTNESFIHCIVYKTTNNVPTERIIDSTENHSNFDDNHGFFNMFRLNMDNQFAQFYHRFIEFSVFLFLGLLEGFFIYCRAFYPHLFNLTGTFMLIIISFGFGIMIYGRFFYNR